MDTGGAEHAAGAGRARGGWARGTSVGGIFVAWLGGKFGEGLFLLNSCLGKKSRIFYKGFFCLFFLQASDGHRVGFHILCWLFE